jgi:hypothetical protein
MSRWLEDWEAIWKQSAGGRRNLSPPRVDLVTSASDFMADLLKLHQVTEDPRFGQAVGALRELGLVTPSRTSNRPRWRKIDPVDADDLWQAKFRIALTIDLLHKKNWMGTKGRLSLEEACALAAAVFRIKANSFAAAVTRAKRCYLEIGPDLPAILRDHAKRGRNPELLVFRQGEEM